MLCLCVLNTRGITKCVFHFCTMCSLLASFADSPFRFSLFSLECTSSLAQRFRPPYKTKVTNTPTNSVKLSFTIQIPLPNWKMICEFMRRKFDFSIQGHVFLFACTTILILPNQTLKFFSIDSIPSPFSLVPTSLHFPTISFVTNLNIFTIDHARENP